MDLKYIICLLSLPIIANTQEIDEKFQYLNQNPPSTEPQIFAPNLISKENEYEFGSVFNNDGTEFFYGVDVNGKSEIRHTILTDTIWSDPLSILSHEVYGYNDPFLSPDEKRLYFISRRSMNGQDELKDHDIWYVLREDNGWSEPINAGPNINSNGNEYYISFTNEGTMYFSSNKKNDDFDIYSSKFIEGKFQPSIPLSDSINSSHYEADVFVDPYGAYLIFCAIRPDGLGEGDLYISFKKEDGTWTQSKNMGEPINSKYHELCPFVSHDGKFLFYTSNKDIYWVDASILEKYK